MKGVNLEDIPIGEDAPERVHAVIDIATASEGK